MDVEENYESQSATETPSALQQQQQLQQQEQNPQQQEEHQQQLLQGMQCEPLFGITTNTTTTTNPMMDMSNNSGAIPLPAPPGPTGVVVTSAVPAMSALPLSLPLPAQATQIKALGTALPTNDYDIDSQLLQQFSCMGTTDHEDLISQFQSLMNNQMNRESARFYLEMSNW